MFINNFDPVALNFLSFEIRWYSLSYIFGIVFAWIYCKKFLIKDEKILSLFDDLITYLIIGVILGGRLFAPAPLMNLSLCASISDVFFLPIALLSKSASPKEKFANMDAVFIICS